MKKIILGLALLGSLAFSETEFQSLRKQFEQKCEAGDPEYCGHAGALYHSPTELGGDASDRDYKKTLYFYKKACDGNVYEACSDLGGMYAEGKGVKKDYKKAITLWAKACDGGNAGSCSNLGVMYANGKGVKKDMTRAMGYYRRSCDMGDWIACGNFAAQLEIGGDRARAAQYYKKACELGKKGFIVSEDKDYLQNACDKYDILK